MEATVLIVSRTKMSSGVCVGGLVECTGEFIRLHDAHGGNLSSDAPYEIGDRWALDIQPAWNQRPVPHVEDRQVLSGSKIDNIGIEGIVDYIKSHTLGQRLVCGSVDLAFEGKLILQGQKNFINHGHVPSFSTQFWITDKELTHRKTCWGDFYYYGEYRLKYVGFQEPIEKIPVGSIIRLSLANWWNGDGSGEYRCYLQISGWYLS